MDLNLATMLTLWNDNFLYVLTYTLAHKEEGSAIEKERERENERKRERGGEYKEFL